MKIMITDTELEVYAREFFRSANTSFADMEDNVVAGFIKLVEKHKALQSIAGHSIMGGTLAVKVPQDIGFQGILTSTGQAHRIQGSQEQQRREVFNPILLEQSNEAETRI